MTHFADRFPGIHDASPGESKTKNGSRASETRRRQSYVAKS